MSRSKVPPLLRLGNSVVLSEQALLDTYALVCAGLRETSHRDGIGIPARMRYLREELKLAAQASMSEVAIADVRGEPTKQSKSVKRVTAEAAAERLGVTTRHVTRNAESLGGQQPGGPRTPWAFDQARIDAEAIARRAGDQR